MPVSWNPSDKSALISLGGGNLTATHNATVAWGDVRATAPLGGGGKWFWSVKADQKSGSDLAVGLANAAAGLGNIPPTTADNNALAYFASGTAWRNGVNLATYATYTTGDVIDCAVDLANSKIWFRKNGGLWNNSGPDNPAANVGGLSFSAMNAGPYFPIAFLQSNDVMTAAFSGGPYTPPSGFSVVDPIAAVALSPASPVMGAPAMGQEHALAAVGLIIESPGLGNPTWTQIQVLVATSLTTAPPWAGGRLNQWMRLSTLENTWSEFTL